MRLPLFLIFFALVIALAFSSLRSKPTMISSAQTSFMSTPSPTPPPVDIYSPPTIATASSYTVILAGDSMTEELGPNLDSLRADLKKLYPDKTFGLFNYGFGSTNILSLYTRLTNSTEYLGQTFPAVIGRYFDVIIIESMGNNPLSQYPLDQGLKLQTKELDRDVALLAFTHPHSVIVFLATIAPSQSSYGRGVVDLSLSERNKWANERRNYIENHINYALRHHIPLINVYSKSMNSQGQALLKYLNTNDYIHPSQAGVDLISQTIADYLFQNHILQP